MSLVTDRTPFKRSMSSAFVGQLPLDLFTSKDIFQSVLQEGWSLLSEDKKKTIMDSCLPKHGFTANEGHDDTRVDPKDDEKRRCVEQLLSRNMTRFQADPLTDNFFEMRITRLAPDVSKMLEDVRKLKQEAYRLQEKEHQLFLWKEVLSKRRQLMIESLNCGPHDVIRVKTIRNNHLPLNSENGLSMLREIRLKAALRYKKELQEIHAIASATSEPMLSSDDEDILQEDVQDLGDLDLYEDESPKPPSKESVERRYQYLIRQYKLKQHKCREKTDILSEACRSKKQISDIIARAAGTAEDCVKLLPLTNLNERSVDKKPKRTRNPSKKSKSESNESKPLVTGIELMSRKLDLNLNSIKKESADVFDFDDDSPTESVAPKLLPTASSTSTVTALHHLQQQQQQESLPSVSILPVIPNTNSVVNHSFNDVSLRCIQSTPAMTVITNPVTNITPNSHCTGNKRQRISPCLPEVFSEPPACFFSLIRDTFQVNAKSLDYKLTMHRLEELVKEKIHTFNPSLGWSHEHLQSAMNYLSYATERQNNGASVTSDSKGSSPCSQESSDSNHIPLVDYKEKNQQWQWIGVCRDSDEVLIRMCNEWMSEKEKHSSIGDPSQPVPPSICPTEWTIKPSTNEERKAYQKQEYLRYSNPNKSFTYRLHSYSSVVGPVKGCGTTHSGAPNHPPVSSSSVPQSSPSKPREHSLLIAERPQFVTVLSLVRDAAARLPNGEGTRSDIVELLKDSQYLLPRVTDQQINQVVSGALDRLHYEKDPCVKYDVNRKLWIYLHRNRTEEDFERLYEMQISAAKAKKTMTKKTSGKVVPSVLKPLTPSPPTQKALAVKKPIEVLPAFHALQPLTCATQSRISVSPLLSNVCISPGSQELPSISSATTTTDKNILNILSKVNHQMNHQVVSTKQVKKKSAVPIVPKAKMTAVVTDPVQKKVQAKQNSIVKQSQTRKPNLVNKVVQRQAITAVSTVQTISGNNVRQANSSCNTVSNMRPIQPQGTQQFAGQQTQTISVPNSVLLNRGGQLVFTNGGRQYMMTPASSGSQQYIAVQSNLGNGSTNISPQIVATTGQQMRGQVIKILSVPNNASNASSNASRFVLPNQPGQFVARIISRPAGINASGSTTNQIMIPSNPAALQNAIFAPNVTNIEDQCSRLQRPNEQDVSEVTTAVPTQIMASANSCTNKSSCRSSPQVAVGTQDTM